jgi:peptidoglycan/LPS O-acetylase OafA/YrhL
MAERSNFPKGLYRCYRLHYLFAFLRTMVTPSSMSIVRPKMPELDSLRGVAILLVVFYHGFFWSNNLAGLTGFVRLFVNLTRFGWLGVNLFFVLSGFLITGILFDSRNKDHYYRSFYARRALRILPAFYGALLLLALTPGQSRGYLLLSFFYLSNLAPLFGIPMTYTMLWSLAVEEHFYLAWPFVVRNLSSRWLMRYAVTIAILVPCLRALAFRPVPSEGFSYYTWLVADGLAFGAILALYVRRPQCSRRELQKFSTAALGLTAFMALLGSPFGIFTRTRFLGATLMLTAAHLFFMAILGFALLLGTSQWSFLADRPILKFFGGISYGLYLVHWMVFEWWDAIAKHLMPSLSHPVGHAGFLTIRFLGAGGAATGLAFLSRRYFEEPFLRLKRRFGP